jgi:hypothetical protein
MTEIHEYALELFSDGWKVIHESIQDDVMNPYGRAIAVPTKLRSKYKTLKIDNIAGARTFVILTTPVSGNSGKIYSLKFDDNSPRVIPLPNECKWTAVIVTYPTVATTFTVTYSGGLKKTYSRECVKCKMNYTGDKIAMVGGGAYSKPSDYKEWFFVEKLSGRGWCGKCNYR